MVGSRIFDLQHLFKEDLRMVGRWRTCRGCHYKTFRGRLAKLAPGLRHLFTEEWSDENCTFSSMHFGTTLVWKLLLYTQHTGPFVPWLYTHLSNTRAFHRDAELLNLSCLFSFTINLISSLKRLRQGMFKRDDQIKDCQLFRKTCNSFLMITLGIFSFCLTSR